jgi:hypothetical protein
VGAPPATRGGGCGEEFPFHCERIAAGRGMKMRNEYHSLALIVVVLLAGCRRVQTTATSADTTPKAQRTAPHAIVIDRVSPRGPLADLRGTLNMPDGATVTIERSGPETDAEVWEEVARAATSDGRWEARSVALRSENSIAPGARLRAHARFRAENVYSPPSQVTVPSVGVTIRVGQTFPGSDRNCDIHRDALVTVSMRATNVLPGDALWIGVLVSEPEVQLLPHPGVWAIQAGQSMMQGSTAKWERSIAIGQAHRLLFRGGAISVPPGGSVAQFRNYSGPGAFVECEAKRRGE